MENETKIIGQVDDNNNVQPVAPAPARTSVDVLPDTSANAISQISAENHRLTPEQVADPYNKAADAIRELNTLTNNDIIRNNIDTIGTERGGQRSLIDAGGDPYITRRYSSPQVEALVNNLKSAAVQKEFNQTLSNNLYVLKKQAEEAVKQRRKRDSARAAKAAAAQAAAAQTAKVNPEQAPKLAPVVNSEVTGTDGKIRVLHENTKNITTDENGNRIYVPPAQQGNVSPTQQKILGSEYKAQLDNLLGIK